MINLCILMNSRRLSKLTLWNCPSLLALILKTIMIKTKQAKHPMSRLHPHVLRDKITDLNPAIVHFVTKYVRDNQHRILCLHNTNQNDYRTFIQVTKSDRTSGLLNVWGSHTKMKSGLPMGSPCAAHGQPMCCTWAAHWSSGQFSGQELPTVYVNSL